MKEQSIIIYTDGSAFGNPGPGGWAAIMKYGKHRKTFSGGYYRTTNNRMELLAVIKALSNIKQEDHSVIIYSDSKYVVNAVNEGWVFNWERKGFKKKKNVDLWKQFLVLYRRYQVKLKWVKGHEGVKENEVCDKLAKSAAENPTQADKGFTHSEASDPGLV